MSAQDRSLELKVGAFVLGALALLLGFFFLVGNPALGPGVHLTLEYAFTGPVKQGAPVKISGINVGRVQEVEFVGSRPKDAGPSHPLVHLHIFVEQRAQPLLVKGSRFYVTTLGLLGEHYVDILPGPAGGAQFVDGEHVRGVDLPRTDLLMARVTALLEQVQGILDNNESQLLDLMTAAGSLMRRVDGVLQGTDVKAFLGDVHVTLEDARVVMAAIKKVLKDPDALAAMLQDAKLLVDDGKSMTGDVKSILAEVKTDAPAMLKKADGLMTEADGMAVRVDAVLKALEKAGLTDDKKLAALLARSERIMERADDLSARADVMLGKIERGEGSVGKLMKDEAVYEDLKALLRELRVNPWKLMVPGKSP